MYGPLISVHSFESSEDSVNDTIMTAVTCVGTVKFTNTGRIATVTGLANCCTQEISNKNRNVIGNGATACNNTMSTRNRSSC